MDNWSLVFSLWSLDDGWEGEEVGVGPGCFTDCRREKMTRRSTPPPKMSGFLWDEHQSPKDPIKPGIKVIMSKSSQ